MTWFISWNDFMRTNLGLKGSELYVYAVIYGFSKSKGKFSGSLKTIEEYTGFDKRQCFNAVKKLTEKGYIKKTAISYCRVEYTAVPLDELKLDGKNAANAYNLSTECETQSKVSNPIADENKSICDEMDAINDKPPDKPQITNEEAEKRLAAIRARLLNKK